MFCCMSHNIQVTDEEEAKEKAKEKEIQRRSFKIKKELLRTRKNNHLGQGISSNVFKIKLDGNYVSCKVIKEGWEKEAEKEIKILKNVLELNNNKLPKFICCFKLSLNDTICYDFIEGHDLFEYLYRLSEFHNNEILIMETVLQILDGLQSLLLLNLVHLDVKPENIIVQSINPIKITIIDLSFCRNYEYGKTTALLGTIGYVSPEMLFHKKIYHNTDIWSIGIIIFLLYTNKFMFNIEDNVYKLNISEENITKEIINLNLYNVPKKMKEIIERCLVYKTNYRISVVGLIKLINKLYS